MQEHYPNFEGKIKQEIFYKCFHATSVYLIEVIICFGKEITMYFKESTTYEE